jgi:hypothetical protein
VTVQNTGAYAATDITVEFVKANAQTVGTATVVRALVGGDSETVTVETPPSRSTFWYVTRQ